MGYGNLFRSFKGFHASRYVVNGVKNLCAIVATSANVANSYRDILKDYKTILMLERLALYFLGANCPFTIFASVIIHNLYSSELVIS